MHLNYDIIIIGAGISGLLLGSRLSKNHSLLIIEKTSKIPNHKYWLTPAYCLDKNNHLCKCIDSHFKYMEFTSYNLKTYRLKGDYILWDSYKIIKNLKNDILLNGGIILNSYTFYSYFYDENCLKIIANDKIFTAKLLVDCMGSESPLVFAKDVIQIKGFELIYGKTLKLKKDISPICASNLIINSKPRFFEVFPTSKKTAYAVIMTAEKQLKPFDDIQKEFEYIVNKSIYSQFFHKTASGEYDLWGIVPVGIQKKYALNRIYFYGESAQINPAASGTGFARMLLSYQKVSDQLSEKILRDELSKKSLETIRPFINKFSRKFQLYIFLEILNWNSDKFAKFIQLIDYCDHKSINDFLFGELYLKNFLSKKNIKSFIVSRNMMLLKPFIKSIF